MAKKILISVTSDLCTDQRVHRAASTLHQNGYDVVLIGRKLPNGFPLDARPYRTKRFQLLFHKGPLFYAAYNARLFFYLMGHKADLLLSNDLDSLLANYLAASIKNKKLVYDSHEYYTGVPELEGRKLVRGTWKKIEQWIFPKLKSAYTVNGSIAEMYRKEYNVPVKVVRNVPVTSVEENFDVNEFRKQHGLPPDKKIIILQGSGINIHRGAEEAVQAMQYVKGAVLLIAGSGDVIGNLKLMVKELQLNDAVLFRDRMPSDELRRYTRSCDLGLSLDKDTNINYRFSLPNKLFDYIHAGIPVLASDLPEIRKIIEQYQVGSICNSHDPQVLASAMTGMLQDPSQMLVWKNNTQQAKKELCWEVEEKKLLQIIDEAFR